MAKKKLFNKMELKKKFLILDIQLFILQIQILSKYKI